VEYYLVTKNNEVLMFAATWMQLEEDVRLTEKFRPRKANTS
jgi:hypothetical protein